MRGQAHIKLRVCKCCGAAQPTSCYSWNQKSLRYSPNCKDCGAWLFLLRKVFGEVRNEESNRINQRERQRQRRETDRLNRLANKPTTRAAMDLYAAFGIGMPRA
jgi:hypothetical protein